ncbi:MAG: KGGVGR-motif variant AAA ATPase [Bryobacteraceae bacterium]
MPFPYVFTFYSYKGGVGRSLAVMNVAYALAGRGRHVLVVDMDLEAPGLSDFLHRSEELAKPESAHLKDILTFLGVAINALQPGGNFSEMARSLPPVSNYIRAIAEEKLADLRPKLGRLGRLDVLGTDLTRDYTDRLSQLELQDLPQDRLIDLSRLLNQYFKAQVFPHRPVGLETFEPPIQTPYDYVLVDSRTGITEIGGLCVGPLADRLVVITGLNDQNVDGTLRFLEETGIKPNPRPKDDTPWDDADKVSSDTADSPSLGPKPTIVVASPVPSGEITHKRERLSHLEKVLGIRPVSLSYHPQMALMESIFVRDYKEEYLASEYLSLATKLMAQVGDDPQSLASEAGVLWNEKNQPAMAIVDVLRLACHNPDTGMSLALFLVRSREEQDRNSFPEMRGLFALLAENPATKLSALNNWGIALHEEAKSKPAVEADRLLQEAARKYAEAVRLKPGYHEALFNWGNVLMDQAKAKAGKEGDPLFETAARMYAEVVRLKPDNPEVYSNWGVMLSDQAKTKTGDEAARLFVEGYYKFEEAIQLNPGNHLVLSNWGAALSEQAKTKVGEEADRLFVEATRKYAEAVRLNPGNPATLNNWGLSLSDQATTKAGEEADRLFEEASQKYAEAVRLKPDFHQALLNWGIALSAQSKMKSGDAAYQLLRKARLKLVETEGIVAGSGAYNLAGVEAKEGNVIEAIQWLQAVMSAGPRLSKSRLASDNDFDQVRTRPEFVQFFESLPEV